MSILNLKYYPFLCNSDEAVRVLWEYCEIVVMCVIIYNFNLKWVKTFRSYERIWGVLLAQCVFSSAPGFWHQGKDKIRFQLTFFYTKGWVYLTNFCDFRTKPSDIAKVLGITLIKGRRKKNPGILWSDWP